MSSRSKGIPGVWKARTGKKGVETMMSGLDYLEQFAICSVDELRDKEIRLPKTTSFCLYQKASSLVCFQIIHKIKFSSNAVNKDNLLNYFLLL